MNAITMNQVSLKLDGFQLEPMTLEIPKGHITALIGRNGAGKTTLFKLIQGVYQDFEGTLKILNMTYQNDELAIRNQLSVVYDSVIINPKVKPIKLLNLTKSMTSSFDDVLFEDMVKNLDIDLQKPFKDQSLGMKGKINFALSLASNKDILLLDEPFNGIDPVYKKKIVQYIQGYLESESHTVIISSHHVGDLERIADHIMILNEGQVIAFDDKETLIESMQKTMTSPSASLEDIFIHLIGDYHV